MKNKILLKTVKLFNVIIITVPFLVCWYRYYSENIMIPFYNRGNWVVIALFAVIYLTFVKIYDGFLIHLNRMSEIIYSQGLSALFSSCIMYVIVCLLMRHLPDPLPLICAFICQIGIASLWTVAAHKWYFSKFRPQSTAIIYDMRSDMENVLEKHGLKRSFDVKINISVEDCLDNVDILKRVSTVFLSGVRSHERNIILKYCIANKIAVYVIPRVGDVIMSSAKRVHILHLPIMRIRRYEPPLTYLIAKRTLDILVSAVSIIIASPIFLIVAIAIKAEDHGPVFYKQCRLTKDGKKFNIIKFRSMKVDAEKDGVARMSTGASDDRVTATGRIIRKFRLDELPQLICILSGKMSLVGPRPERPEIAAQYEKELPEFSLRLQAKAGLTGYAQVYGKYNTAPYDKLQMDLLYIANPSIIEDFRLIFATIKILFVPESTEGIEEGTITA